MLIFFILIGVAVFLLARATHPTEANQTHDLGDAQLFTHIHQIP